MPTPDESPPMQVTYRLTPNDLATLIQFHNTQSPVVRRQRMGCLFIFLAAILVLPVGILIGSDEPLLETASAIWPLLLGPVLFAAIIIPYSKWKLRRITKRMLKEGRNPGFDGECTTTLQADGIHERRPSGINMRTWESVERIVTTPEHLFIYTSAIEAFVIPRRAFASDLEFANFVLEVSSRSGIPNEEIHR